MKRCFAAAMCLLLASCTYRAAEPTEPADKGYEPAAAAEAEPVVPAGGAVQLEESEADDTPPLLQNDTDFSIEIVDSSRELYDREYMLSRLSSDPLIFEGRMFYGEPLLTGFSGIMGCDGVAVRTALAPHGSGEDSFENYLDYFCTDINGRIVCIAEQFGYRPCGEYDSRNYSRDLDGDGVCEFITNNTYGADGVTEIRVYRMQDGVPYVGIYSYEPQHSGRIFRKYTEYDGDTGIVKIYAETYTKDKNGNQIDGDVVEEERPLSIDDLVFTEYKR